MYRLLPFAALLLLCAGTLTAQDTSAATARQRTTNEDSLRAHGVVILQSAHYGVELSGGLTSYMIERGVPVYLEPLRVLLANPIDITGGEDVLHIEPPVANDFGFRPPESAYGLIIDVATGLPSFFGLRNQTRVYMVDRSTGQVLRFVTSDGLRDDDDARRVYHQLVGGAPSRR